MSKRHSRSPSAPESHDPDEDGYGAPPPEIDIPAPFGDATDALVEAERILQDQSPPILWHLLDCDHYIGGMRPGWLVTVGSRPANGKTTFLTNWLDRLFRLTTSRVCYVATEMAPATMYLKWAAFRLLLEEHLVMARDWQKLGAPAVTQLADEVGALTSSDSSERVWFPDMPSPRLDTLLDLIRDVIHYRYDVLVLDHLHRVEPMAGQDERQALQTLCRALKTAAVKHRLLVVVAGHLRREDTIFDRYHPPHLGSWLGSSAIEGESDLSLGLYRPLRKMTLAEERSIRSGELPISDFVIPDTMAVRLLKHRFRGDVIDRILLLHCRHGVISNYAREAHP